MQSRGQALQQQLGLDTSLVQAAGQSLARLGRRCEFLETFAGRVHHDGAIVIVERKCAPIRPGGRRSIGAVFSGDEKGPWQHRAMFRLVIHSNGVHP